MKVVAFAGYSGSGKTTLVELLIVAMRMRGLRVSVIKHAHHSFDIDQPGKDSSRLRAAGATPVMLSSPYRRALISEWPSPQPVQLADELAAFPQQSVDLILVEGFKRSDLLKVEVWRKASEQPVRY
jgi:molybdopterin-guanine dinucleotide biosynthesis protein B